MTEKSRFVLALGLVVLAVLSRWIPHPSNFTPLLGLALFAGAWFSSRIAAVLIPLIAMIVSDLFLGWHSTLPYVYLGMGFAIYLGWKQLKSEGLGLRLVSNSVLAAVVFFVISNLGVWISEPMYTHDLQGLVTCFTLAIPFFPATLVSTLVYAFALFGLAELAQKSAATQRA